MRKTASLTVLNLTRRTIQKYWRSRRVSTIRIVARQSRIIISVKLRRIFMFASRVFARSWTIRFGDSLGPWWVSWKYDHTKMCSNFLWHFTTTDYRKLEAVEKFAYFETSFRENAIFIVIFQYGFNMVFSDSRAIYCIARTILHRSLR
jgi:hypothetical protein